MLIYCETKKDRKKNIVFQLLAVAMAELYKCKC